MASKKDMEEVKRSLSILTEEVTKLSTTQKGLLVLIEEVCQLKTVIEEKDKTIGELERRVEDLEQYSRIDDLVIAGLKTTHRSYARAAAGDKTGEDAPIQEQRSLEQQVIQFFNNKDIPLDSSNIAACHTLPQRQNYKGKNTRPNILIRFVSRKHKIEVLKNAKKLKDTGVYVNEHLTKRNGEIAKQARILRKAKKIQDTWTRNCKVMVRLNDDGTPENAKVLTIRDIKELEKYK